jgi:hypothetical protein
MLDIKNVLYIDNTKISCFEKLLVVKTFICSIYGGGFIIIMGLPPHPLFDSRQSLREKSLLFTIKKWVWGLALFFNPANI